MSSSTLFAPKLGRDLRITNHHLRIFEALYRFDRVDLPTLAAAVPELPWNRETLRRRMTELQSASCVHVFNGTSGRPPIYALLDRGLAAYLKSIGEPTRRTTQPAHCEAERIRTHECGLSRYLVARNIHIAAQQGAYALYHRDLFQQASDDKVRREQRWPIAFTYKHLQYGCHLKPDALSTYGYNDWHNGIARHVVTEFDASTETVLPRTFKTRPANIHGKLVTYAATIEQRLLEQYFGMTEIEVEFVFLNEHRRQNVTALAQAALPRELRQKFFFAVQPLTPSEQPDSYVKMRWFDGSGIEVAR